MDSLITNSFANGFVKCDAPTPLTDFDGSRYMGTWYEQQHIKGQFFQPDDTVCVEAEYTGLSADGHFNVNNTEQKADFGARSGINGTGYCPDATGHCYVTFFVEPKTPNYQVVETDYESYSIVYSCGNFKQFLWLLTREPVVSDELYNQMLATAKASLPNFNFDKLNDRDYQGDKCTYNAANYFLQ